MVNQQNNQLPQKYNVVNTHFDDNSLHNNDNDVVNCEGLSMNESLLTGVLMIFLTLLWYMLNYTNSRLMGVHLLH